MQNLTQFAAALFDPAAVFGPVLFLAFALFAAACFSVVIW
jgi:hypothetical protein